jgi:pyruvate dehydrogenase E2 component (dihydrolipoamide acetyltransferase)
VAASPPVRRLAKELGLDLAAVTGTGPGGRVTREDVLRSQPRDAGEADGTGVRRIPVKGTRRLIADKMARSLREIPHVTTFLTVDAWWLQAFRREIGERTGERVTPLAIVVRALATTCGDHPKLNGSYRIDPEGDAEILLFDRVHVGIATDTDAGLLVPVVRDAQTKGIGEIARDISRLTEAARTRRATPDELTGSTITVSNVGTFGAEFGTPIINHPEGAVLAVGVIEPRALVIDDEVVVRPAMTLSLSFDHRLLDGAEAGRALRALADALENAFSLGAMPR